MNNTRVQKRIKRTNQNRVIYKNHTKKKGKRNKIEFNEMGKNN